MFARGWEEGGMNSQHVGFFSDSEIVLYDAIMIDTCYFTFVKIHRTYNAKSEP